MRNIEMAVLLAKKAAEAGGRAYYVGGYVRDRLMGTETKDIDIEVHGITPEKLNSILEELGSPMNNGKSFGIQGLKGYDIDIAMPRKEKAKGLGHRDFDILVDPYIGVEKAALRRDFTVNALMEDVLTGEVSDCFGGLNDLKEGVIRHVNDETFAEDALRVLRAAQFAARLKFRIADETIELCKSIDLSYLSGERIEGELRKALLKSDKPSVFFMELRKMNQLDVWFPELKNLIGLMQNPYHHSEGDVWNHTMMVLDEAVKYRDKVENPFGFMLAALTHDFGKAICTEVIDGKIKSHGHETKGLPVIKEFLKRITNERKLILYVLNLAEYHMKPNMEAFSNAPVKTTNRMFDRAVDPEALIYIAMADSRGKISQYEYVDYDGFLFHRLEVFKEYMARPYVTGKDLVEAGITEGPVIGEGTAYAHKLRLAGIDKESALKQTIKYLEKR